MVIEWGFLDLMGFNATIQWDSMMETHSTCPFPGISMGLKPFNHLRDFLKKNPNPKRAKVFR
jgi:hypothetical protein